MEDFDIRLFMASVRKVSGAYPREPVSFWELFALLRLQGESFLTKAYRDILFRAPDRSGFESFYSRSLTFPGRVRILLSLLVSPENVHTPQFIQKFLSFFRKPPEA